MSVLQKMRRSGRRVAATRGHVLPALRRFTRFAVLCLTLVPVAGLPSPPDEPIPPQQMVQMLGKGFDVSWAQFRKRIENYSVQMVRDIAAIGFRHIRLRTNLPADSALFAILDPQVQDCLDNGLIPIIAYGANEAEENPDSAHLAQVVQWWRTVAEHYQDVSHRLLFDIFIELSGELGRDPDKINRWYQAIVPAIRESNPTRILILSPARLSAPEYLDELQIPDAAFPYVMAEWHFYAAGPSKTNPKKLWTTGTEAERKLVTDKIQIALDWQRRTGIPTWVGAWMPGNYNKGNDYTVPEQVVFASFMVRELEKAGIPWAVNAIHKFYDDVAKQWIQPMLPVVDAMIDPWKIALYRDPGYGGPRVRLGVGDHDATALGDPDLAAGVASIMVPDRMRVTFYADSSFASPTLTVDRTDSCLIEDCSPVRLLSVKVETTTVTGIERARRPQLPAQLDLRCFPNPFNSSTAISLQLARAAHVRVRIWDARGRLVRTVAVGKLASGTHRFAWDGLSESGQAVPSGVYLVAAEVRGWRLVAKVLLLR